MSQLIRRHALKPDAKRVVVLPFQMSLNSRESATTVTTRIKRICSSIRSMNAEATQTALQTLAARFASRHRDLTAIFQERFRQIRNMVGLGDMDDAHATLIGAYFSHEYSYQAAAILNPSVVPHPDQSGLNDGEVRYVLTTRCVGEGHISSIGFRVGVLHPSGEVTLEDAPAVALAAQPISRWQDEGPITLGRAAGASLTETVIFPSTRSQINGIEDLRLVRFQDGEAQKYVGTYTAFSGRELRCEMFESDDFSTFRLIPMRGEATLHKALAFFPRKINGKYAAIGRLDHESLFFLESDDIATWEKGDLILSPQAPWELMQVGNCGSPVELDEGWLVITHGVGPLRQYALGAILLDKDNPRKVLKRSSLPLLEPCEESRDGYAPNAIYSCGSLRAGEWLFLPHALADTHIDFATIRIADILASLTSVE